MMNLANRITLIRIVLSPVFFIVFSVIMASGGEHLWLLALLWVIFLVMELSDLFDGMVARKLNQASALGKLLDPFADSFSRITYFICFVMAGIMPFWIFIILIYRDLIIAFLRLYLSINNIVLGAKWSGKVKAWIYAFGGIFGLLNFSIKFFKEILTDSSGYDMFAFATMVVFGLCAGIALISLIDYLSEIFKVGDKNQ